LHVINETPDAEIGSENRVEPQSKITVVIEETPPFPVAAFQKVSIIFSKYINFLKKYLSTPPLFLFFLKLGCLRCIDRGRRT
jgi:hypothetical protein